MRMRIIIANDIYYVLTLASEPYKYWLTYSSQQLCVANKMYIHPHLTDGDTEHKDIKQDS